MAMLELNTNLLAEIGGWPAMKEARALVDRKRVFGARREGNVIRAKVQGGEKAYDAEIALADRVANVEVKCTCLEFRKSGRVCAHVLAAGLAFLQPQKSSEVAAAVPDGGSGGSRPPLQKAGPKRWLWEEAPVGKPKIELMVLLPVQLRDSLSRDPVRFILEARRENETQTQYWDALAPALAGGYAVQDEDEQVLAALEEITGAVKGLNEIPRAKMGQLLRALSNHPRVWLGKKERVEVKAATSRTKLFLKMKMDGGLELQPMEGPAPAGPRTGGELPIPGWMFNGREITETATRPPGFTSGTRLIPRDKIPGFLTREFPALERTCELVFAPGFTEFQLEIGKPSIEARLEGALSGLTLDLIARYGDVEFSLNGQTEPSAYQRYLPDPRQPNRFWRRNILAEREALAQVAASGFQLVRTGTATFTLHQENAVTRFLANVLPRWRRVWTVQYGARLEATMRQIDVAEPEFSLRSGSGEDWLSLDLKLSVAGKPVPLDQSEIQRWLQTGQSHARLADKRVLLVPTEAWSEMREVLADCEVDQEPGQIRVKKTFVPFLTGALTAQGFRGTETVAEIPKPDVKAMLEEKLWAQLRPYQAQGVEWLAGLSRQGFHGLLADDMGLGKTLQALAFCAWVKGVVEGPAPAGPRTTGRSSLQGNQKPTLVVCPTSLVTNWLREAVRFTPHLRTLDLTGPDRAEKWAKRGDYDLLVTSYAILRRDVELYRGDEFSLMILDEAQHIKNRGSQNAQGAKALKSQHRLILSGTPLENSVLDLWSLFDFLLPGYLGTANDFRERYETPLTKGPEPKTMERLRQKVKPFFLRRTKEEVLTELPPKLEHLALCELTDEQREVYRAVLAQGRREVFDQAGKSGNKGQQRIAVLTTLLRLRQVCCHLDLLPAEPSLGTATATSKWKEPSAKLERTFELIDEAMDGGHRVLLFSQFVRVLHLLRDEAKRREIRFCYLDGQTLERQAEVDRFQNDAGIPLFFISLKAGGTGLNLTGADTVIHFDPWWNPAVEEQAMSRAHRMGQSRSVQAYKLIAAGTVEEKIQALQSRKRELFEASLGGDEAFVDKLTGGDLEELLAE